MMAGEVNGRIIETPVCNCFHREDRPARIIKLTDTEEYFRHGLRHRLDGPAMADKNGKGLWYINGFNVDGLIRSWANEMNIDLDNLAEEDKTMIAIKWGNYDDPYSSPTGHGYLSKEIEHEL